ncbi:hypothetical protein ACFPJ4_08695 [Lysinimonas soli]|uniref:Uncharacterized protein n=1 Tax=Lysinimonas soli TaxID=1074233 RepID=A0ABW0NSJ7_9MICO
MFVHRATPRFQAARSHLSPVASQDDADGLPGIISWAGFSDTAARRIDSEGGPSGRALMAAAAAAICAELVALILSSSDSVGWIAIILLQLGIAVVAIRVAMNRRRAPHHAP